MTLSLFDHFHQPAQTPPYDASHAIFVREFADTRFDRIGLAPDVFRRRLHRRRSTGRLRRDDVRETDVAYLHGHHAKRGCYAASIERI